METTTQITLIGVSGLRIPKGNKLYKVLMDNIAIRLLVSSTATYFQTDHRKNLDLRDFGIAEIAYDHSAIIVTFSGQTPISKT